MTMPGTPEGSGNPVVPPSAETPPSAPPAEVDLETPLEERTYTKAEMQSVRAEAAARRVEARDLKAAQDAWFDGLDDRGDFDYLLNMAKKLNTDPHASRQELLDLAERLGKDLGVGTTPPPAADDKDKPLTRADLEKIDFDKEVARQQVLLKQEAASFSDDTYKFEDGREEFARLLWIAQNDPEVSKAGAKRLESAAAKIKAHDEATGKAAVAAYIESVRSGASQFPPASAPAGGAPAAAPGAGSPKGWKAASESAMEKLIRGTA